ncbi:uncharacterized protein LOC111281697 [Durio zibethinus]|uniref:Uncharacterized protein LOC111281697 n=1 Tax=Durio zibethinus TaxID=66656 RepID=A0A6P5XBU6_DURZI|nr:uncharacterized protein LOC111281697 [Durio zibethinus]
MKTEITILLLFVFVFVFSSKSVASYPVIDVDGDELRQGQTYYVLHHSAARLAVTFTPMTIGSDAVVGPEDLNIMSIPFEPIHCNDSTVWKIKQASGGVEGDPLALSSRFRVKAYTFAYCPSKYLCGEIEVYEERGFRQRRLVLTRYGSQFLFVKAETLKQLVDV